MPWADNEKKNQYQRTWRARRKETNPEAEAKAAEAHAARQRAYYHKNKELLKAQQAEYRDKNRDKIYAQQKEYRKRNRLTISDRNRKKKYGLSHAEFATLVKKQSGRCAICRDKLDVKGYRKIHVDHCHETKLVRSILCSGCNVGLGHFREHPELLRRAAAYAEACNAIKEASLCESPDHRDSFVDLVGYTLTGAEINGVEP